jgi:hypothetical protein
MRVLPPLAPPAAAQGAAEEPEVREPEYNPHRVFIRLEDLERHGFTAGCRRCILMREGRRSQGVRHRDECRNRVEQALRDAGDVRLDRAERRVLDELERRAADGEPPAEAVPADAEAGAEAAPDAVLAPAPATPNANGEDDAMSDVGGDAVMRLKPSSYAEVTQKLRKSTHGDAKVSELYSPPRVTTTLPKSGLVAGSTFDLYADEAGVAWDFTLRRDRQLAWQRIRAEEPYLVVGSPPCTMFSRLQLNLNAKKIGKVEWERRRREAEVLLVFAVAVYALQVQSGRHFLHEHPAGATSWGHPAVVQLRKRPGVGTVTADMCEFGMRTTTQAGSQAAAKKPTRFMSSSPAVLEALSRRCRGDHEHAPLLGGARAKNAAVYPPGLCSAITQGAAEQLRRDGRGLHAVHEGRAPAPSEVHCGEVSSRVQDEDDELAAWPQVLELAAQPAVFDEITGATLSPELVRQARAEEIKFMLDWGVWERALITDCWRETGKAPIGSKWVDVNKGDATKPLIRSDVQIRRLLRGHAAP